MSNSLIMLVDDEMDLLNLFSEILEKEGFEVKGFRSPTEALEDLRQEHQKYTLVISDFRMPEMDGEKFSKEIKKINSTLPIVILSASDSLPPYLDDFPIIKKPISTAQFIKQLCKLSLVQ